MMQPSKSELKRQVGMLQYQRGMNQMKSQKQCCDCATLFRDSMIDMMLIPLYYAWMKLKYGTLSDIRCENYLLESYNQFVNNAKEILQDLVIMLGTVKEKMSDKRNLVMIDSLLATYDKVLRIV